MGGEEEQNIASETKLPGGLRKKKKRLMLSVVAARARQGRKFSYMKGIYSQELSRETNRKSEITPRWARYENTLKSLMGIKRERNGERRVNANVGLLSK